MCKRYKHITSFKFGRDKCKLCVYLNRYRFSHTKNQFQGHVYQYKICISVINSRGDMKKKINIITLLDLSWYFFQFVFFCNLDLRAFYTLSLVMMYWGRPLKTVGICEAVSLIEP